MAWGLTSFANVLRILLSRTTWDPEIQHLPYNGNGVDVGSHPDRFGRCLGMKRLDVCQ